MLQPRLLGFRGKDSVGPHICPVRTGEGKDLGGLDLALRASQGSPCLAAASSPQCSNHTSFSLLPDIAGAGLLQSLQQPFPYSASDT